MVMTYQDIDYCRREPRSTSVHMHNQHLMAIFQKLQRTLRRPSKPLLAVSLSINTIKHKQVGELWKNG